MDTFDYKKMTKQQQNYWGEKTPIFLVCTAYLL